MTMNYCLYLVSIILIAHGCVIENDYEDDQQCSLGCSDLREYEEYGNMDATVTSDCTYNYTCLNPYDCCTYVAFYLGDEVPLPEGATSNRSYGHFDDRNITGLRKPSPVDMFAFFGMKCISGDWYGTKFPYGLAYMVGTDKKHLTAEELAGKKIKILKGDIMCPY